MPTPLFNIGAACRLDITPGSSSHDLYFALAAQYQFGVPVIGHFVLADGTPANGSAPRAPAELASTLGISLFNGPSDPGYQTSVPGVVVDSFPYAVPSIDVAGVVYPVDVHAASGTLVGVNYVDQNGVLHPDVDWAWYISVDAFLASGSFPAPIPEQPTGLIVRGLCGFERGTIENFPSTGGVVSTASARSGIYGFEISSPTAAAGKSCGTTVLNARPTLGEVFDFTLRAFFQVVALPSLDDRELLSLKDTPFSLQINTAGQLRAVYTWAADSGVSVSDYTTAYGTAITTGTWYGVELRLYGYGGDVTYMGRMKQTVRVFNAASGATVFSSSSPTQAYNTGAGGIGLGVVNGLNPSGACPPLTPYGTLRMRVQSANPGWVTVAPTRIASLLVNTPSNGVTYVPTNDFRAETSGCFPDPNAPIQWQERGTFTTFNEPIETFLAGYSFFTANQRIFLGQEGGAGSFTQHLYYDDWYWEWRTGSKVNHLPTFPYVSAIHVVIPTAQGASDAFSPTGAFARVNEIPVGSDDPAHVITSSTLGATSTYTHSPISANQLVVHVRYYLAGKSGSAVPHAVVVDGVEYPTASVATSQSAYPVDPILDLPATTVAFNALQFGVRQKSSGVLLSVNQCVAEVLAEAPVITYAPTAPPPYVPPSLPSGGPLSPGDGPSGGGTGCVSSVAAGAGPSGGSGCSADLPEASGADAESVGGAT